MTIPCDMADISKMADKLLEAKAESTTPIPMTEYESMLLGAMHELSLPTIREIYREVGIMLLKYAAGIGLLIAGWLWLSAVLDEVAAMLGC